jgi:hypothetical protein
MKLVSKKEKEQMVTKSLRKMSPVRARLLTMKVNEHLFIESGEWKWKSAAPSYLCRRVESDTKMKFECEKVLEPEPGWIITRLE